jgi:hypothetical protein
MAGCALVWGALFASGSFLVGSSTNAVLFTVLAIAGGIGVGVVLKKTAS